MANKLKTLLKGSENQGELEELLGNELENFPGSEKVKKTYKKELLNEIEKIENKEEAKTTSPFPEYKGYTEVWDSLTIEQQEEMRQNFRVSDGEIECIPMKKKFSILTAKPNNENIFDGSYIDKNGNTGIEGVTYLTGEAAEIEAKNQGKKLLKNKAEVERFIDFFPGKNEKEKIYNLVKLFGLEKTGGCSPRHGKEWFFVGSVSNVSMSLIYQDYGVIGIGMIGVIGVIGDYDNDHANIYLGPSQNSAYPWLACEDC